MKATQIHLNQQYLLRSLSTNIDEFWSWEKKPFSVSGKKSWNWRRSDYETSWRSWMNEVAGDRGENGRRRVVRLAWETDISVGLFSLRDRPSYTYFLGHFRAHPPLFQEIHFCKQKFLCCFDHPPNFLLLYIKVTRLTIVNTSTYAQRSHTLTRAK